MVKTSPFSWIVVNELSGDESALAYDIMVGPPADGEAGGCE